jgi:hypothetical protein
MKLTCQNMLYNFFLFDAVFKVIYSPQSMASPHCPTVEVPLLKDGTPGHFQFSIEPQRVEQDFRLEVTTSSISTSSSI